MTSFLPVFCFTISLHVYPGRIVLSSLAAAARPASYLLRNAALCAPRSPAGGGVPQRSPSPVGRSLFSPLAAASRLPPPPETGVAASAAVAAAGRLASTAAVAEGGYGRGLPGAAPFSPRPLSPVSPPLPHRTSGFATARPPPPSPGPEPGPDSVDDEVTGDQARHSRAAFSRRGNARLPLGSCRGASGEDEAVPPGGGKASFGSSSSTRVPPPPPPPPQPPAVLNLHLGSQSSNTTVAEVTFGK